MNGIEFCGKMRILLDGLLQERRNSIANELELRLCYSNPSMLGTFRIVGIDPRQNMQVGYCAA